MEFAYTAIITETGSSIGIAYQDMAGHYTVDNMPTFGTYSEAQDYADTMNIKLGLTTLEAWKIVASSMKASHG